MVQVINDPNRNQSFGGSLASGLSSALQGLAHHKVSQLQQKQNQLQTARGLRTLLPELSDKDAHGLAMLDPKILEQVVKQKMQAPQEEAFAQALSGLLGTGQQEQQPQQMMQQQEQPVPENVVGNYTPWKPNMTDIEKHLPEFLKTPEAQQLFSPEQQQELLKGISKPQQVQQPKPRLNAKNALELAKLGQAEKKIAQKERHFEQQQKREQSKELKQIIEPLIVKKNAAEEALDNIKRRRELETEGKGLDTAGYNEYLKRSGWDIPALRNPESEEYNKSIASGVRGIKDVLGSKITQGEVQLWMQTLPSLSNSPSGRKRIDATLSKFYNLEKAITEETIDIIRKNPDISPLDLLLKVDEKMGKKREAIASQFREDLKRPVPESQNKLVTAAQTLAGDLVGGVTKGGVGGAAKGALAGAAYGKYGGGPGTAVGAGLGGLAGLLGLI